MHPFFKPQSLMTNILKDFLRIQVNKQDGNYDKRVQPKLLHCELRTVPVQVQPNRVLRGLLVLLSAQVFEAAPRNQEAPTVC